MAKAKSHFGDRPSLPVGCSVDVGEYRRMRIALHRAILKLAKAGLALTRDESEDVCMCA